MILAIIIVALIGYCVGHAASDKSIRKPARQAVNAWLDHNEMERKRVAGSQNYWYTAQQVRTHHAHSMLKLSKYLGLKNETEKQTFN